MLHQRWEFIKLFRNVWFTFSQEAIQEVKVHDVSIGQLEKIKMWASDKQGLFLLQSTIPTEKPYEMVTHGKE